MEKHNCLKMSAQTDVGSRLITLILTPFPSILHRGNGGPTQDCGEWELAGGKKGNKGQEKAQWDLSKVG